MSVFFKEDAAPIPRAQELTEWFDEDKIEHN